MTIETYSKNPSIVPSIVTSGIPTIDHSDTSSDSYSLQSSSYTSLE